MQAEVDHSDPVAQSPPELVIPEELSSGTAFPTYQIIHTCCVVISLGRELGSDKPSDLTSEERIAVTGCSGFLSELCTIHGQSTDGQKSVGGSKRKKTQNMSMLQHTTAKRWIRITRAAAVVLRWKYMSLLLAY